MKSRIHLLIALLLLNLFSFSGKCQPGFVVIYNTPQPTTPSGNPVGGPVSTRPDHPGMTLDEVNAQMNNRLHKIQDQIGSVAKKANEFASHLDTPTVAALGVAFPRLKKHYDFAKRYISEINQEKEELQRIANRPQPRVSTDIDDGTKVQQRMEASKNSLNREIKRITALESTVSQLPKTLNFCKSQTGLRREKIEMLINRYKSIRQACVEGLETSDGVYTAALVGNAINVPIRLVYNYTVGSAEYLIKVGETVRYVDVIKDVKLFWQGLMENNIKNGEPITGKELNELNEYVAYERMKEKYLLIFDPNNTINIIKDFDFVNQSHQDLVNQQRDLIHQIDYRVKQLQNLIKLDEQSSLENYSSQLEFLKSTSEAPTMIPYRHVPFLSHDSHGNDDIKPISGLMYPNNVQYEVKNYDDVNTFKVNANKLATVSNQYITILQSVDQNILPAISPLFKVAIDNFKNVITLNNSIQSQKYFVYNIDRLKNVVDVKLLADLENIKSAYNNGTLAMNKISIVQQLFKEGNDDLTALMKIVQKRDDFYQKSINRSSLVTGSVLNKSSTSTRYSPTQVNKAYAAIEKLINSYVNYSGIDPYSLTLISMRKNDNKSTGTEFPTALALSKVVAEEIRNNDKYDTKIFSDLFFYLEDISMRKILGSSVNSTEKTSNTAHTIFQASIKNFQTAKANHKKIFDLLLEAIPMYLQSKQSEN